MDDRDLNTLRGLEQDLNQKFDVALTQQGGLTALEAHNRIEECRAKIADLIPPSDWTTILDLGWSNARRSLQAVWQSDDSRMEGWLLPWYHKLQFGRRRIELIDGVMFRPVFRVYEEKIFGIGAENVHTGKQAVYGLTGPQGFGKSAFLHCLAIKRSSARGLDAILPFSRKAVQAKFGNSFLFGLPSSWPHRNSIHEVLILDP